MPLLELLQLALPALLVIGLILTPAQPAQLLLVLLLDQQFAQLPQINTLLNVLEVKQLLTAGNIQLVLLLDLQEMFVEIVNQDISRLLMD